MIDSPVLRELKAEWTREGEVKALMTVLEVRFGGQAETLETELKAIADEAQFDGTGQGFRHLPLARLLSK